MSGAGMKAGVAGWPVDHSLSPLMMEAWLADAGLAGSYERIAASPDTFAAAMMRLREAGYAGVNVTLPHKEAALALAGNASAAARAAGAANVLVFRKDGLFADNTDIDGIRAALAEGGWQAGDRPAVLVGAGGAARAAFHVLKSAGVAIRLINRTPARAEALSQALQYPADIFSFDQADAALDGAGLIINATSLGMRGQAALKLPLSRLAPGALVFDMVYIPLETPLLAQARALEVKTVDGLSMLIGQARPAFRHFFVAEPPSATPVRDRLLAALEAR